MPMATDNSRKRLLRTLIWGKDKTKKTWWACKAAEAGYNVILIDGDDGSTITQKLPLEAQEKILIVDAVNSTKAVFARFMATFMRPGQEFLWDEQEKVSIPIKTTRKPDHSYIYFCPTKFTANDVVIIDSWTALAASTQLQYATEQDIDLTAIEKEGDQFALLGFQSRFLDYCLNNLHALPCHVIVIGHETVYEKWEGKGKDRKMVSSQVQPISSTGPQGMKLGKHFNDVLHFSKLSDLAYRIDAGGDKDRSGGSRTLEPKKYDWKEVTPKLLFDAIGSKPTGEECAGAIYIGPGQDLVLAKSSTTNTQVAQEVKQLSSTPATETVAAPAQVLNAPVKSSLLSMMAKKTG